MKAIKYYILFLIWPATQAAAQNVMTSSPYFIFGVGEIAQGLDGQNMAMGNVSYGMRGASLINHDNSGSTVRYRRVTVVGKYHFIKLSI